MNLPALNKRDPQTKTKHLILERYARSWGGIILNGLLARARRGMGWQDNRFVYVDAFSHAGRYSHDTDTVGMEASDAVVWGSPIIGIHALDDLWNAAQRHGVDIQRTVILCEEKRGYYNRLLESLEMAGCSSRVREDPNLSDL